MKVCSVPGCPELQDESRCPTHRREAETKRGTREARGYGSRHRGLSKKLRSQAIGKTCHFCGRPMRAGEALALDHTEDRATYRGVVHFSCNSRDGAKRGNALRS